MKKIRMKKNENKKLIVVSQLLPVAMDAEKDTFDVVVQIVTMLAVKSQHVCLNTRAAKQKINVMYCTAHWVQKCKEIYAVLL